MNAVINEIHNVMKSCKTKLRNRAVLRNVSDLNPVLNNETRWSSTRNMILRYNRIRSELVQVSLSDESNLEMNVSTTFKNAAV